MTAEERINRNVNIRAFYNAGADFESTAKQFNLNVGTVRIILKGSKEQELAELAKKEKAKKTIKNTKQKRKERRALKQKAYRDAIVEDVKITLCNETTGENFGITGERVRQIVKIANINIIEVREATLTKQIRKKYETHKDQLGLTVALTNREIVYLRRFLGIRYDKVKAKNIARAVTELYDQGVHRAKISTMLGLHYRTVSKYLKIKKRKPGCLRGRALKRRDAEIYRSWLKKKNEINAFSDIGKAFDLTPTNIFYSLKRHLYGDHKSPMPLK